MLTPVITFHVIPSRTKRVESMAGDSGLKPAKGKMQLRRKGALLFSQYKILSFYFRVKLKLFPEGELICSSMFLEFSVG